MNRRELLEKSALLGLVAGVGSMVASQASAGHSNSSTSANSSPAPLQPARNLPAAFVLGKDAVVLDFSGPLEVFSGATTAGGEPLFAPYRVAATKDPVTVGGGMKILPDYDFRSAPQPKLIVIPAMSDEAVSQEMISWIRNASKATALTMSVCNGAFVLAKTGLLDGKSAVCHHSGFFSLAANHPKIHVKRGARFVEEGNLATAGGVSSGVDLAMRVVERYVGHEAAVQLADGLEYQGKGWLDPNSNEIYARMPTSTTAHPRCAVCYMPIDRSISTDYQRKIFYFCSTADRDIFAKNTDVYERFLAEDRAT